MRRKLSVAAVAVAIAIGPAGAAPADLVPYRAIFDLMLAQGSQGADANIAGRMAVEFSGSRCTEYKSTMRLVTGGQTENGDPNVVDTRTTTVETTDGRFEFTNQTYVNDRLAEESVGTAVRGASGIEVKLTKPAAKTLTLDSAVVFPTEQMNRLIDAARAGERFVAMDVYDGSQTGDVVYSTATVIGPESKATDDLGNEPQIGEKGMAALPHWPLTVSYFEKTKGTDDLPAYVMSFTTYENGIGRKLRIDYGKFALAGKLTHLDILPTPAC